MGRTPPRPHCYQRLIDNELDATIAQAVAQGAPLEEFFEVDATLGRAGASRKVVALVGPPGVGKTTTLIKLAARYGLASRKPAHIISTDVYRIAAADQLRSLASILGIGCDVVETPVALAQALEEHRSKDLVFIDTPGLANGEMEDGADLARLIATHPEIDTHLVLAGFDEAVRHGARDRTLRDLPTEETLVHAPRRDGSLRRVGQRIGAQIAAGFVPGHRASRFPTIWNRRRRPRLVEMVGGTSKVRITDNRQIGAAA